MLPRTNTLDTTLREGALQPGLYFSRKAHETIATELAKIGTPRIEFPLPNLGRIDSNDILSAIKAVKSNYNSKVILHCGINENEYELAASYDYVDGIGVYEAITQPHREMRLHGKSIQTVLDDLVTATDYIKSQGIGYRRATLEDVSRIFSCEPDKGPEDNLETFSTVIRYLDKSNANVIGVVDSSGRLKVNETRNMFNSARRLTNKELSAHFHNDYGIALVNALEAAKVGNIETQVTIGGFGARVGITDHYSFAINYIDDNNPEELLTGEIRDLFEPMYRTFEEVTGVPLPANHPLSINAITEKAGRHQQAQIKCASLFTPYGKVLHDFKGRRLMEASTYLSKHVVKDLVGPRGTDEDVKILTDEYVARARLTDNRLPPQVIRDIALTKRNIDIPLEEISRKIRGNDFGYILVNLVPQADGNEVKRCIRNLNGVINVETTYGGTTKPLSIDMLVETRRIGVFEDIKKLPYVSEAIPLEVD